MTSSTHRNHRPRRTQASRREESERRLLEALTQIIAEQGVSAATFESVAARAGFSRGLASQKFGSKDGMTRALIARLDAWRRATLAEHHTDTLTGREAIETYVQLNFDELVDMPEFRAYFSLAGGAAAEGGDLRAAFAEAHGNARDLLAGFIRRGQEDGSINKSVSVEPTALILGSLLLGAAIHSLLDPDADLAAMKAAAIDLIERGL